MTGSGIYKFGITACYLALGVLVTSGLVGAQTGAQSSAQAVDSQSYGQDRASSGGWRRVGEPPTPAEQGNVANDQGYGQGPGPSGQDMGNGVHVYDPNPDGNRQVMNQPPPPSELTIPPGTYITVRVNQELSSSRNHAGDTFTATLEQPVVVNGIVVASPGETVSGRITEASKSGRIEGLARLGVQLTELSLVDGQQIPIQSQFISQVGPGSKGRDAGAIAGTTGLGALIGAAAAGGSGAAIGAGAGAAASAIGVLVTRGHDSVIGPEEMLTFRILAPVTVSTASAPQAFRPIDPNQYKYASDTAQQQTLQYRQAANPPVTYYGYGYPGPYYSPFYSPYAFGYGFGYPYYGWGYPYWGGVRLNFYSGPRWYGGGFRGGYGHGGFHGGHR
ncbi:MAG TPA: hypothetical protein VGE93_19450 [Bryobacteraceae bacterium]